MSILEENFTTSIKIINNLKIKPNDNELLNIYKYYKQANFGDNISSKPFILNFKDNSKWTAWSSVKGMEKKKAMQSYIDLTIEIVNKYK